MLFIITKNFSAPPVGAFVHLRYLAIFIDLFTMFLCLPSTLFKVPKEVNSENVKTNVKMKAGGRVEDLM